MTRSLLLPLLLSTLAAPPLRAGDGTGADPVRTVLDAHAAARAGRRLEALRAYRDAADAVPGISDWLLRRAAMLSPDSLERAGLYARIRSPMVRARLVETEAAARERAGDLRGAAVRYDSIGRVVDATRLRLALTRAPRERAELRRTLVDFIGSRAGTPDAQAGFDLLASARLDPTPQEALILARAAWKTRQAPRAVSFYPRAILHGLATADDRLSYGMALAQVGRYREALAAFDRIPAGSDVAAEAAYQRASAQSRAGQKDAALAALKRLASATTDSTIAARALFLAADISWRAREEATARALWLELVKRYPRADNAGRAGFLAGMVLWEEGRILEAGEEWERLHQVNGGNDGLAAGYWAGRAFDQAGQAGRARGLWLSVIARDSLSYYSVASARRLGINPWSPAAADDHFQSFPDLDSTSARLALLRGMSMTEEIGWERDWLLADQRQQPERLLAAADVLRRDGQPSAAVTLARRALKAGAPADARTYRLIFPLLHGSEVREEAATAGVEPSLVAALIRQESTWESTARSRAGALGLMQVMPATGRHLARSLGVTRWNTELLFDPATNIRFGTRYLADAIRRFQGDLGRALAAYNAGPNRVDDWAAGSAASDPDLFVERITIPETRDYVRIVQRNLALYRSLYADPTGQFLD